MNKKLTSQKLKDLVANFNNISSLTDKTESDEELESLSEQLLQYEEAIEDDFLFEYLHLSYTDFSDDSDHIIIGRVVNIDFYKRSFLICGIEKIRKNGEDSYHFLGTVLDKEVMYRSNLKIKFTKEEVMVRELQKYLSPCLDSFRLKD